VGFERGGRRRDDQRVFQIGDRLAIFGDLGGGFGGQGEIGRRGGERIKGGGPLVDDGDRIGPAGDLVTFSLGDPDLENRVGVGEPMSVGVWRKSHFLYTVDKLRQR
jgi:hypothetical protein